MTNQQHPIVPDPELLKEWYDDKTDYFTDMIRAAQWGADQELEACCEWLVVHRWHGLSGACITNLRADRRPRPLSLKEQALAVLEEEPEDSKELIVFDTDQVNLIRRALEALPE
jgi:hypothetical protein